MKKKLITALLITCFALRATTFAEEAETPTKRVITRLATKSTTELVTETEAEVSTMLGEKTETALQLEPTSELSTESVSELSEPATESASEMLTESSMETRTEQLPSPTTEPTTELIAESLPELGVLDIWDYKVTCPDTDTTIDVIESLLSNGSDSYHYFWYDPETDKTKEGTLETARGIHLGDALEAVQTAYGDSEPAAVDYQTNRLYYELLKGETKEAETMKSQCVTMLTYPVEKIGKIDFYFDENNTLSWIMFYMESADQARNSKTESLKEVQELLNEKKYDAGYPDGVWGPKTEAAIKEFQKEHYMEQNGTVDKELLETVEQSDPKVLGKETLKTSIFQ